MSYKASFSPPPSLGDQEENVIDKRVPDTLATLLPKAANRLGQSTGLERREARLEAQVLSAHALGVSRSWLISHDQDVLNPSQINAMETLIARREAGEPVAYILGEKEFFGRLFRITPDVLIPRPETELLLEAALERLPTDQALDVLDIGTGSGCIAITLALERPNCAVTAVDISAQAISVAAGNANHLGARIHFLASDLYSALGDSLFDAILSNPPYIAASDPHLKRGDLPFEPRPALTPGPDGLHVIRAIVSGATSCLRSGGMLMLEHGYDQGASCRALFQQAGFSGVNTLKDLAGLDRVTLGHFVVP